MLGKTVLASNFPTVRSQIEHMVDGYVVRGDAVGLADGVRILASDQQLRDSLASATSNRDYGNISEVEKVANLIPPAR